MESAAKLLSSPLRLADDDNEYDEKYEAWSDAKTFREILRRSWSGDSSRVVRAHELIRSAPWISDWASEALVKLEAQAESSRLKFARLISPQTTVLGAITASSKQPDVSPENVAALGPNGSELVNRIWREWQSEAAKGWSLLDEHDFRARSVVREHFGRRRKGLHEALEAAERIAGAWSKAMKSTSDPMATVEVRVRLPIANAGDSHGYGEYDGLTEWSAAVIATHQKAVSWPDGIVSVECPTVVAKALYNELIRPWHKKDDPFESGALIGDPERDPESITWGPAIPPEGRNQAFQQMPHWPAYDSIEPPRMSILWGRRSVTQYGDRRLPRALAAISDQTDLRRIRWPEWMTPGDEARALRVLIAPASEFDTSPFTTGSYQLGPLANLQVFATNALNKYVGKSHGIDCKHTGHLSPSDQIFTLAEFLEIERKSQQEDRWTSRWCSKCGGYSVRRMNADQIAYYLAATDQNPGIG